MLSSVRGLASQKTPSVECVLKWGRIYLVVPHPGYTLLGDRSPFSICAHPQLWVDLVLGYHLASEYMSHEQVVVHRLCDDLCDRGRVEFEEGIVFRLSGLASGELGIED